MVFLLLLEESERILAKVLTKRDFCDIIIVPNNYNASWSRLFVMGDVFLPYDRTRSFGNDASAVQRRGAMKRGFGNEWSGVFRCADFT